MFSCSCLKINSDQFVSHERKNQQEITQTFQTQRDIMIDL